MQNLIQNSDAAPHYRNIFSVHSLLYDQKVLVFFLFLQIMSFHGICFVEKEKNYLLG